MLHLKTNEFKILYCRQNSKMAPKILTIQYIYSIQFISIKCNIYDTLIYMK